jgi:hypothetical protein
LGFDDSWVESLNHHTGLSSLVSLGTLECFFLGMLVLGKAKLTVSLSLLLNNLVDNCIKKLRLFTTILVLEIIADYQQTPLGGHLFGRMQQKI